MNRLQNLLLVQGWSLPAILAAFTIAAIEPAVAGPDCLKNPEHPKCGGGSPPPPPPPPPPGVASCPGDFPAFAYAVELTNKRGRTIGNELRVSNADGSCELLVHTESERSYDDLAFHRDSASGVFNIAFNYESDEADTRNTGSRPNVRVIRFTIGPDGSDTKINEALPLTAHKIYRYARNSSSGRGILANDIMGNSIVFSLEYGEAVGTNGDPRNEWYDEIWVIEDIDQCIADFGPEPDENCATLAFAASVNRQAHSPVWGVDANRIYFRYDWQDPRDSNRALALIDRTGSGWSAPGAVRLTSDTPNSEFDLQPLSVARRDFGLGPVEAMSIAYNDGTNVKSEIFSIDGSCTAAAAMVASCYAQGLMMVQSSSIGLDYAGYWSAHSTIGSEPNLLRPTADGAIREFEPVSGQATDVITGLGDGWLQAAPDDSF